MSKKMSLALQVLYIKNKYPDWVCKIGKRKLLCKGFIRPTEISCTYTIEIAYKIESPPKLKVVYPELRTNAIGEKPPHLYEGGYLCVYHPDKDEWNETKPIALTIIPWITLWLYFYEIWLATGEWKGEGEHPSK